MARRCVLSQKQALSGNNVSHAHNKTRRKQLPNVHKKRIYVEELGKSITIKVSSAALRTINKIGLLPYLRKQKLSLKEIL